MRSLESVGTVSDPPKFELTLTNGRDAKVAFRSEPVPPTINGALAPESRATLRAIDLHFHDLRHEAGCRTLERGWPLHHIQEMLGHANLSQTSTYLHAAEGGLQDSMRRSMSPRVANPWQTSTRWSNGLIATMNLMQTGKDRLH